MVLRLSEAAGVGEIRRRCARVSADGVGIE